MAVVSAGSYSSDLTPSLGTSCAASAALKSQKKKKENDSNASTNTRLTLDQSSEADVLGILEFPQKDTFYP